jgi:hypothetical protein
MEGSRRVMVEGNIPTVALSDWGKSRNNWVSMQSQSRLELNYYWYSTIQNRYRLCQFSQPEQINPSIYGATALSGPWPPSQDASINLYS